MIRPFENGGESEAKSPKFPLGAIVVTAAALSSLSQLDMIEAVIRHQEGDWGELEPEDIHANERALVQGLRLFSVYRLRGGTKFYVITEHDRSVTTILLPSDY